MPEEDGMGPEDVWSASQARHRERIHAAARELIQTGRLTEPASEILYFIVIRLHAALRQTEQNLVIQDDRPLSLVPFPPVAEQDYMEWLLIEWADDHAIEVVFPQAG